MLHGSSGNGEQFLNNSGWRQKANREGFIAAFPTGRTYLVDEGGTRRRSTRWGVYGLEDEIDETVVAPANDVGFLRRLIADVATTNSVARNSVYLSGFSSGGSMCMRAALEMTTLIHGFGCNAGTVGDPRARIRPGNPSRPVMFTYGNLDRNLLPAAQQYDPSLTEVPMNPRDALANRAVRGLVGLQLLTLRLGEEADVLIRRPTIFDVRFDTPISQAQSATNLHFVLLDETEHVYPNGSNNPNGFVMADILWRFFRS